jgi:hypothetical protein
MIKEVVMKRLLILLALGTAACDRAADNRSTENMPTPSGPATAMQAPASRPATVVPKPKDPAQLDRMILAGYTPHADHLHAPGVNECPLTKGSEAVM